MDTLGNIVGTKIRAHRKLMGISQMDLADLMQCESTLISRYERGVTLPSIGQLINLAVVLKIPPSELLPEPEGMDTAKLKANYLRQVIAAKIMAMEDPEQLEDVIRLIDSYL